MDGFPFLKKRTFSEKLLDYYEYECCNNHTKFLYFCLILWIIEYNYSDIFIKKIFQLSQFQNKSHIYDVLKNKFFPFKRNFVIQKKSQVNQLFFMMLDLKVRISFKTISEIKSYIHEYKIREHLDKLFNGYQDTIKMNLLEKILTLSSEKKLKWFLNEKERILKKKRIKKPLIPAYYANSENTWVDNRPLGSLRYPLIKSIPFGGQNKKY